MRVKRYEIVEVKFEGGVYEMDMKSYIFARVPYNSYHSAWKVQYKKMLNIGE